MAGRAAITSGIPVAMRRQAGAAVIVAMLIVALAAIVASNFMFRTYLHGRKLENAGNAGQARWLLRAAEQWGAAVLFDDEQQSSVDHRGEIWAQEMPPVEAEGYRIAGRIEEMSGKFNINGLISGGKVDEIQLEIFRRLLTHLRLPVRLADAIADRFESVLRSENRLFADMDELLEVKGMTAEFVDRLRLHATVLDRPGLINVNTASPELLAALSPTLTVDEAHVLAAKRDHAYFRNSGDLRNALGKQHVVDEKQVAFSSRYFLVIVSISRDRVALESRALWERNGRSFPRLVRRSVR